MVTVYRKPRDGVWLKRSWCSEITKEHILADEGKQKGLFEFFNEIGIINQLATSVFNHHLPEGLHLSHFTVLNHLTRVGDGRTPVQISRALQVTKATITHTLGVLEGRKFISIRANPEDRRSKLVYLTPAGNDFRIKAIQSLAPAFKKLALEMNIDELQAILPTLCSVREVLDNNRNS